MDPGRLSSRLVIEAPNETPDGQGGVVRSYAPEATVWAEVTPRGGAREREEAGEDGASQRARIVMRSGPTLSRERRIVDGDCVYRIVSWRDEDAGFVSIEAETRLD
jgi:head-tail adaptor